MKPLYRYSKNLNSESGDRASDREQTMEHMIGKKKICWRCHPFEVSGLFLFSVYFYACKADLTSLRIYTGFKLLL